MKYIAYIGLGSNLASTSGNPAETIRAAVHALGALGSIAVQSSLYRTAPVGFREQPYFINAAVCLETDLEPEDLLRELLAIERSFGRDRAASFPNGPRTLDLDLLLVVENSGAAVLRQSAALTLPHPEIANRRFVLEPLTEIAPELRHPVLQKTVSKLLEDLASQRDAEVVARLE